MTTINSETEINKIRINLYEETKNLTVEQRVKRSNKLAEKLARQYGFTVSPSVKTARTQIKK